MGLSRRQQGGSGGDGVGSRPSTVGASKIALSSCGKFYTGKFSMFVDWCETLAETRASQPASEATVTLYLQSVMNSAKTFAPVKTASAAIAFY